MRGHHEKSTSTMVDFLPWPEPRSGLFGRRLRAAFGNAAAPPGMDPNGPFANRGAVGRPPANASAHQGFFLPSFFAETPEPKSRDGDIRAAPDPGGARHKKGCWAARRRVVCGEQGATRRRNFQPSADGADPEAQPSWFGPTVTRRVRLIRSVPFWVFGKRDHVANALGFLPGAWRCDPMPRRDAAMGRRAEAPALDKRKPNFSLGLLGP